MRGQSRLVLGALRAGAIAFPPAVAAGWAFRGGDAAAAVAWAMGLVVANFVASSIVLRHPAAALPSYAVRMVALFIGMSFAYSNPRIDDATFTVAFACAVVGILVYECVLWARTPWLAIEFGKERS